MRQVGGINRLPGPLLQVRKQVWQLAKAQKKPMLFLTGILTHKQQSEGRNPPLHGKDFASDKASMILLCAVVLSEMEQGSKDPPGMNLHRNPTASLGEMRLMGAPTDSG